MIVLEKKAGDLCCPVPWPNGPIRCRGAKCAGWGWEGVFGEGESEGGYGYCRMGSAPRVRLTPQLQYPKHHWGATPPPSRPRTTMLSEEVGEEGF